MAILITGEFRIHSKANLRNVLTVNGAAAAKTAVVCRTANGKPSQVWRYYANRFYTETDPTQRETLCLDMARLTGKADIAVNNNDANQQVKLISIPNETNHYRISLRDRALFLTTDDNGNCTWTDKLNTSDQRQIWVLEKLARVTDMPRIDYYRDNDYIEYFSACSGWKTGSFENQKWNVIGAVQALYDRVSGGGILSVEDNPSLFLYNFPGALAYGQGGGLDGYYHMGIDINYGKGSPVYPLKAGKFVGVKLGDYSAVGIESSFLLPEEDVAQTYVIWYLHMEIAEETFSKVKGDYISLDTKLGKISNQGQNIPDHLHIEVQKPKGEPMVPSSAGLHLTGNYFGAYNLLDLMEEA